MGGTGGRSNQDGVILRDRSRTGPAPDTKSNNSSSPGGTVERVALTMPAEFTVAGSPVTKDGTLAVMRNPAAANTVLAGPVSGSDATPAMRALVAADLAWRTRARVSRSTAQTFTTATEAALSFNTEEYDTGGYWVVGSPTIFTIPANGTYLFMAACSLAANATGNRLATVYINGSAAGGGIRQPAPVFPTSWLGNALWLGALAASDTIEIRLYQNSGGNLDTLTGTAFNWMAIERLA